MCATCFAAGPCRQFRVDTMMRGDSERHRRERGLTMGLKQRINKYFWTVRSFGRLKGDAFYVSPSTLISFKDGAVLHLGRNVHISGGGRITIRATSRIEEDVFVGRNLTLVAFASVDIGRRTRIGENVSIHTENHRGSDLDDYSSTAIILGERCWVGAGVVLTEGSRIGAATVVGANAVVKNDLPAGVIAAGVPAKVVRARSDV